MKKKIFWEKFIKVKNQKKNKKFLRGPTAKVKPQFDGNYCEKQKNVLKNKKKVPS